jgi:hypothetical protein
VLFRARWPDCDRFSWHGRGVITSDRIRLAASLSAIGLLAVLVVAIQQLYRPGHELQAVALTGVFWLAFVPAATLIQSLATRASLRLSFVGGALLQFVALRTTPFSTDDHLRYVWDGRVQGAGISPYRYPPGAPELAFLRDPWLFPDGHTPALNHPLVRTIYPPVAQAWFWFVDVLPGGPGRGRALQIGSALLALATMWLIARTLTNVSHDPRRVVWWSLCPTVVLEAGGNAHVDVLGALLVVATMAAFASARWARGGVLLGLAIATKVLPALIAVAVPPRRSLRVGLAAVGALATVYLPHIIALGTGVTGFLGGYLAEESRDQFDLIRFALGNPWAGDWAPTWLVQPAAAVILAATALSCWRWSGRAQADGQAPWLPAATMVGVTFMVLTPPYPWYGLLLVPLVALGGSRVWLAVCAAPYLVYASDFLGRTFFATRVVAYGLAALAVMGWFWRQRGFVAAPGRAQ